MRWLTFALLAAVALCFQTTAVARLSIGRIQPDFLFIVVAHYALHSRDASGLIAAWVLGLLTDLASVTPLGMVSMVDCLAATAVWSMRDMVFTRHPLTHLTVTAAACALAQVVLRTHYAFTTASAHSISTIVVPSILTGLYTGMWAVPVQQVLLRAARPLGLKGSEEHRVRRTRHVL